MDKFVLSFSVDVSEAEMVADDYTIFAADIRSHMVKTAKAAYNIDLDVRDVSMQVTRLQGAGQPRPEREPARPTRRQKGTT